MIKHVVICLQQGLIVKLRWRARARTRRARRRTVFCGGMVAEGGKDISELRANHPVNRIVFAFFVTTEEAIRILGWRAKRCKRWRCAGGAEASSGIGTEELQVMHAHMVWHLL